MKPILTFLCMLLCCSCLTFKEASQFTTDDVKLGMDKTEFIKKFGEPYNKEMYYTDDHCPMERLFYKEEIFSNRWTTVITAFTFCDSKLVEQEFINDRLMYPTTTQIEINQ